jgi:hypothetical protein
MIFETNPAFKIQEKPRFEDKTKNVRFEIKIQCPTQNSRSTPIHLTRFETNPQDTKFKAKPNSHRIEPKLPIT